MLRVNQIKLPLGHPPAALKAAILKRLRIPADALLDFAVFKRAHDARNKAAIAYIYTLDVTLADEAAVLKRFAQGQPGPARARYGIQIRRPRAR